MTTPKLKKRKITDYIPDNHNANKGTERGLQMLEQSLNEDGAGRSIVVDMNGNVPAGNKTLEAAMLAGIEDVIEIETDGKALIVHKRVDWDLSDPHGAARRYAYRDNRTSQVSLTWDANVIAADVEAGVDLSQLWTPLELEFLIKEDEVYGTLTPDERYTRKIDIPIYEPSATKPAPSELYDATRLDQLLVEIDQAPDLTDDERRFLKVAAHRHAVMNFSRIADFYAHSSAPVKRLMEHSALVIIDFNQAIELGYAKVTKEIAELVGEENDN